MAQRRQTTRRADARRQQTRAQRREAERKQRKDQAPRRGLSPAYLVGGALALIAIAVIAVVVFTRANPISKSATGPPITTPGAYQPNANLLKVGTKAPNFTLKGVDGKSYSLAAQRGHPVVLEFFAVWCPHCQAEAPTIQKLADKYRSQGVRVWSILSNPYGPNYDNSYGLDRTPASAYDLKYFARTYREHVPQLISPNFAVPNEYGVHAYPGIYVINKKGVITHTSSGERPQSVLDNAINSALK